jgi:predicted flap endonuclease-1-like 5' DNA nuclease
MPHELNHRVALRLEEVARLLQEQNANPFRVRAWQEAGTLLRRLPQPIDRLLAERGLDGLRALPGVGEVLARAIRDLITTGRLPMLERLRGEADPEALLRTVPGIGPVLAARLHHDLGIASLEDLEAAAHDGRLASLAGLGSKRIAGIRDSLAERLRRTRPPAAGGDGEPPLAELLDVDREYRAAAAAGRLRRIAPRRFNPAGRAWLPILHTTRGERHYTALYSNTARAHRLGHVGDWVVLYCEAGDCERQHTVVTGQRGPLAGRRLVAGREAECRRHYGVDEASSAEESTRPVAGNPGSPPRPV